MKKRIVLAGIIVLFVATWVYGFVGTGPFGNPGTIPGKAGNVPLTQCTTIKGAAATDDYPGLLRFAYAVTLRGWHCVQAGATKVIGGVDNCDGNATNCHAISVDGNCTTVEFDNSTLNAYSAVGVGSYVGWHTTSVTGTNTWVTVCVDYTID